MDEDQNSCQAPISCLVQLFTTSRYLQFLQCAILQIHSIQCIKPSWVSELFHCSALTSIVGVPSYQTLLKRPPISHFTTFEWSLLQSSVVHPLYCSAESQVVPSLSPVLRVWNGHKVTISSSVGDSDGSIRRLLKSKNATQTLFVILLQ